MKNTVLKIAMGITFLILLGGSTLGQSTGVSRITLNSTSIKLAPYGHALVAYNVSLVSGKSGLTNISYLQKENITYIGIGVNFSKPSGYPPYNGIANISLGAGLFYGVFAIQFVSTGSAPSSNYTLLLINITNPNSKPVSTTSTIGTSSTTSTIYQAASQNENYLLYVLAAVIIIVIIAVILYTRKRGRTNITPQPSSPSSTPASSEVELEKPQV